MPTRRDRFATYVSYIQIGIAFCFFIRDMKFCRIPYALLNSLWHKGYTCSKLSHRDVLRLVPSTSLMGEVKRYDKSLFKDESMPSSPGIRMKFGLPNSKKKVEMQQQEPPVGNTQAALAARRGTAEGSDKVLDVAEKQVVVEKRISVNIGFWLTESRVMPVVKSKHYLMRGSYISQVATDEQALKHLLAGGEIVKERYRCIIDQSGDDEINKNFLKFISIVPPFFQARGLTFASAIIAILLYFVDLLNKNVNRFWQAVKNALIFLVKRTINLLFISWRREIIGVLSSASPKFRYGNESRMQMYWMETETVVFGGLNAVVNIEFEPEEMLTHTEPFDEGRHRRTYCIDGCVVTLYFESYMRLGNI